MKAKITIELSDLKITSSNICQDVSKLVVDKIVDIMAHPIKDCKSIVLEFEV